MFSIFLKVICITFFTYPMPEAQDTAGYISDCKSSALAHNKEI